MKQNVELHRFVTMRGAGAGRVARGFTLLEMLVAIVIMGVSIALTYRSLGDGASKSAELMQRQRAMILMEGLLQTPADRLPQPLPYQGASGDLIWRIEHIADAAQPEVRELNQVGGATAVDRQLGVTPVALRYTVAWAQGQRQLSVVSWRFAPRAVQATP